MADVYARVEGPADRRNLSLLTKAQRAWHVFREAQAAYCADRACGGPASKLLWLSEKDRLTRQRIESLRQYLSDNDEE